MKIVAGWITEIEVDGTRYALTELRGRSYSIRDGTTGDILGVFLLDEEGTRVTGADGLDLPLTMRIANAALDATMDGAATLPPEPDISDNDATYSHGAEDGHGAEHDRETIATWRPAADMSPRDRAREEES